MIAYTVGLGCDRGVALDTVRAAVQAALAQVAVPNPSETVRKYTGTPSVSEAAALLAAGPHTPMTALVVEKHKHRGADGKNATVSIARKTDEHGT